MKMVSLTSKLTSFFSFCINSCGKCCGKRKDGIINEQLNSKHPFKKVETSLMTKTLSPQSKIKVIKFDLSSSESSSEDKSKSYSKTTTSTETKSITESTTEDLERTTLKEPLITRVTLSNDEIILCLSGKQNSAVKSRIPSEELTLKELITLLKLSETSKDKQRMFPSLSEVKKYIENREAIKQQPPKVSIIYEPIKSEPSIFDKTIKIKMVKNDQKKESEQIQMIKKSPIRLPKKFPNILINKNIKTKPKMVQTFPKEKETIMTNPVVSKSKIFVVEKVESPTELPIKSPREPIKDLKFDSESKMTFMCQSLVKTLEKSLKENIKEKELDLIDSESMKKEKINEKIELKNDEQVQLKQKSVNTLVTSLTTNEKEQLVVVKFNDKIIKEEKYPIDKIITVKLVPPGQRKSIKKSFSSLKRRRKSRSLSTIKTRKTRKIRSLSKTLLKSNDHSITKKNFSLKNNYKKKKFKSLYRRKRSAGSIGSVDSEYSIKSIDTGTLSNKSYRIQSKSYKSNSLNRRIKKSQPYRFGSERDLIEHLRKIEENRKIIQEKYLKNQYKNSFK